jgi:hypothetical protein
MSGGVLKLFPAERRVIDAIRVHAEVNDEARALMTLIKRSISSHALRMGASL